MTGTTNAYAIPYPSSDDPIAQGAETIRQGVERVDSLFAGAGVEHFTNLGSPGGGWGIAGLVQEGWREGPNAYIYFELRRSGQTLTPTGQGGFADDVLLSVDYGRLRPPRPVPFHMIYKSGGATFGGSAEMYRTGTIVITSVTPNTEITQNSNVGEVSLYAWIKFIVP